MNELIQIFLTSAVTIVGGVIIYTSGQIISRFFLEPILKQAETIGDISDALVYYAREISSPGLMPKVDKDKAHERLRQLASLLKARSYMIRWYDFFSKINIVPKLKAVETASGDLIVLSNSVYNTPPDQRTITQVANVRSLLKIPEGSLL